MHVKILKKTFVEVFSFTLALAGISNHVNRRKYK